jgi:uncharacterized protein
MGSEETRLHTARHKETTLQRWLRAQPSILIGFSGGVDSTYLGCVAVTALGTDRVLAVIGRSASYPAEQWEAARAVAAQFGLPILEVQTEEMHDPHYVANPSNRCYFCKTELWKRLAPIAHARCLQTIVDGTNADDLTDYRPGTQAAREHGIRSPLAEVGLTKVEIRLLSRERGIPTWANPSSPCLASRLPYGLRVTPERLRQVECAERALREVGVTGDLRVRHHGELARVELARHEVQHWLEHERWRTLAAAVHDAGFRRVAIDLRGFRSGSLNVLGNVVAEPAS